MRIAILGCGSIGQRHAANLRALGHGELLAFDPEPERAATAARQAGALSAATLEDVWKWQPAVVVVAAPPFRHVELAIAAARRGCDLFVEKPLAHTLESVPALLGEVRARKLVTLGGCNMRFHPGPVAVKRLIETGAVGDILCARLHTGSYLPGWRPTQDYRASYSASAAQGGGALLDCIHEIDLALWLFGPATLAAAVVRRATALRLDVDGLAELLLEHGSGAVSSVHLNFVQRDYRRECQVIGTEGTVYWSFEAPAVVVRRGSSTEAHPLPAAWTLNEMYVDEMRHFLDCVVARRSTVAPLEQGAAALQIALEARARMSGGVPA